MNYTESFDQFASRLSTTDVALYAGVGLVIWVLFKDKLSPVQKLLVSLTDKLKGVFAKKTSVVTSSSAPVTNEDIFFKLVVSWKQTRDLAEKSGCSEAVKVADQMFPYLSPTVCKGKTSL
ncbi:hypothetical protein EB001_17445 [bacterium]|jgi:hypothetical protein|nr:hypothetical protein [bacterium]